MSSVGHVLLGDVTWGLNFVRGAWLEIGSETESRLRTGL